MHVPPFSLSQQLSDLGTDLDLAVLRVLRSGQFIGGDEVKTFEDSFAKSIGVQHVVGCNSGTDALILALRALDIGVGDEVITSSFSFFATAEAISAVGAKPVFVDVEISSYLLDLADVERAITSSTKAILPVHLFGRPVDMDQLMYLAKKYELKVVEDCAQASGAKWQGRSVGSWGDIGCFSFFPTKNLGAFGDGGAVTTKDKALAKKMRELAVHGMPRRYLHTELGYNSRLDAIQAAVLNVKLPKLSSWIKKRQIIAERYIQLFNDLPGLAIPGNVVEIDMLHAWNQFVVRVNTCTPETEKYNPDEFNTFNLISGQIESETNSRDILQKRLQEKGVNTIIYYPIPIHLQPAYKHLGYRLGTLPITEKICQEVLSLPMFPELSIEQQNYVSEAIINLLNESNLAGEKTIKI